MTVPRALRNSPGKAREYFRLTTARYHRDHPGYFARKTREWREGLSERERKAFSHKQNQRMRVYIRLYGKLRRLETGECRTAGSMRGEDWKVMGRYPLLRAWAERLGVSRRG